MNCPSDPFPCCLLLLALQISLPFHLYLAVIFKPSISAKSVDLVLPPLLPATVHSTHNYRQFHSLFSFLVCFQFPSYLCSSRFPFDLHSSACPYHKTFIPPPSQKSPQRRDQTPWVSLSLTFEGFTPSWIKLTTAFSCLNVAGAFRLLSQLPLIITALLPGFPLSLLQALRLVNYIWPLRTRLFH